VGEIKTNGHRFFFFARVFVQGKTRKLIPFVWEIIICPTKLTFHSVFGPSEFLQFHTFPLPFPFLFILLPLTKRPWYLMTDLSLSLFFPLTPFPFMCLSVEFISFPAMLASFLSKVPSSFKSITTTQQIRWATKKAGGSTKNGRDSNPKFLGVKVFGNEKVKAGAIIVRQRGMKYRFDPVTCHMGKDHTIMARIPGWVRFDKDDRKRQVISVLTEPMKNAQGHAL
jgi:large subunit ribosomal protein L27